MGGSGRPKPPALGALRRSLAQPGRPSIHS
jgi:hypothetical protein